jgi:hypothetical protein
MNVKGVSGYYVPSECFNCKTKMNPINIVLSDFERILFHRYSSLSEN